jgi:crossover junction endodeoxyribonuclease RuvC
MNKEYKTLLGIDPGTSLIGFGVIKDAGNKLSCLEYGTIRSTCKDTSLRLLETVSSLENIIKKHKPTAAAIEKLFFFKNQKTAMSVSETRGVLMFVLARNNIPIYEFTPLQVKQAVSNYGKAEKRQIQRMVRMLLKLEKEIRPDDAADALALAICCATQKNR